MDGIKKMQELVDQEFASPAHDDRDAGERVRDLAKRGIHAPSTLSLDEIRQVSFALSVVLIGQKK